MTTKPVSLTVSLFSTSPFRLHQFNRKWNKYDDFIRSNALGEISSARCRPFCSGLTAMSMMWKSVLMVNPLHVETWDRYTASWTISDLEIWQVTWWLDKICLMITAHPRFSVLGTLLFLTQTARKFDLTSERQGRCFTPLCELPKMGFREAVNS